MIESSRMFQFPNRVGCVCMAGLIISAGMAFGQTSFRSAASSPVISYSASTGNDDAGSSVEAAFWAPAGESKRQEASEASAGQGDQAACPKLADSEIPTNEVVDARVAGWVDSGHLKPGKEIWLKVAYPIAYQGCTLDGDSVIYGKVMSATSSKSPNSSELSILFDHADCAGQGKKQLKFWLIAVVAPQGQSSESHDAVPTEVAGGGRRIDSTAASTTGYDARLNPGGAPNTVKPGIVVGYPKIKLEPSGGPGCSAKLTSTDKSVHLGTGTELIMTLGRPE
ncbi:MAG TPA: hypothetical protein VMU48_05675 [Terracidiphilus sp.]|nr:hypothetical protein [Terracidiphilus sp.]